MTYDGATPEEIAAAVRCPRLVHRAEVTSTLDVIHELADEGAPHGTVVLADMQTRGRGRQGRAWNSPRGAGVWLGYLHRPPAPLETGVLALRVGLAVARAIAALGVRALLKWPNDVLIADRKVAGVLCETRPSQGEWVGIGVGMNVLGPLPDELTGSATTLETHAPGVTRLTIVRHLIPELHRLQTARELEPGEQVEFATVDWLAGRRLAQPVEGEARGVTSDGALLVLTPRGLERILGGPVRAA